MDKVSPTRSQINFITKLREGSSEREDFIQKFLEEKLEKSISYLKNIGKDDISELTVKEASGLIELLKG